MDQREGRGEDGGYRAWSPRGLGFYQTEKDSDLMVINKASWSNYKSIPDRSNRKLNFTIKGPVGDQNREN